MNSELERKEMLDWSVQSAETPGWHVVISPEKSASTVSYIFRLNLQAKESYTIESKNLEMNPVLIQGLAKISNNEDLPNSMKRFDSFYIPKKTKVTITAVEDCIFYIPGAEYCGIGTTSFRAYDSTLPIGDIHQIHGTGSGSREVMFTLDPKTPASRLICGLTWGGDGAWTSWPPHQHEKDLEEVYCYFDMPDPKCGFHISYLRSGEIGNAVFHKVKSGTFVQAPKGYHPTVSAPGTKNAYLWALVAFTPKSRDYNLAKLDPALDSCEK